MFETYLKESIRQIVREVILEKYNIQQINEDKEDDNNSKIDNKRSFVNALLKKNDNDKYDHAHLAYKLWPKMNKDAARSYFSKCVRGERNFDTTEITSLYNMLRSK